LQRNCSALKGKLKDEGSEVYEKIVQLNSEISGRPYMRGIDLDLKFEIDNYTET